MGSFTPQKSLRNKTSFSRLNAIKNGALLRQASGDQASDLSRKNGPRVTDAMMKIPV